MVKNEEPVCKNCVHFNDPAPPSKPKCQLTGLFMNKTQCCKLHAYPVPYEEIEVGDLIEYWWVYDKPCKGLVLLKDEQGHLSVGEEGKNGSGIPNGRYKTDVIRIITKQAIDGPTWLRYGVYGR